MKENPLQYRVRGTPVPTTQTRGTNYPKSTAIDEYIQWYNTERIQQRLKGLTPMQYRNQTLEALTA